MAQLVKTVNGLAIASVKTLNALAIASAKTINGLDNTAAGGTIARVAFVGSGSTNSNGFTSGSLTVTGANFILVALAYLDSGIPATFIDSNLNTYTALTLRSGISPASLRQRLFYCENANVTGGSITFTVAGVGTYASICAASYSGVKLASSFDAENGAVDASNAFGIATGSVTPSVNNELVATGLHEYFYGNSPSIDSSFSKFVEVLDDGNHVTCALADKIQTTATAENPTWSYPQATKGLTSIACFKAA